MSSEFCMQTIAFSGIQIFIVKIREESVVWMKKRKKKETASNRENKTRTKREWTKKKVYKSV